MKAIDNSILKLIDISEGLINLSEIIGEHLDNDWLKLTHKSIVVRRNKKDYNHYVYFQEYKFYIHFGKNVSVRLVPAGQKINYNDIEYNIHIDLNDYDNRTLFHIHNGKVNKELINNVRLLRGIYHEEAITNHPTLQIIKFAIQDCKSMIEAIKLQ